MNLYVGTSGFSYKEWVGAFYPEKLPAKEMLANYAARLPIVEINNTFYRMPNAAAIQGWRAEFFIPYALLRPLQNVPPKPGTRWRINVYRMDYDEGKRTQWDWAPVGDSFHEFEKFGELVFGGK